MKHKTSKKAKVALCRVCHGTGKVRTNDVQATAEFWENAKHEHKTCPQCQGSGRVLVSAEIEYDIRPYKPNR